MLTPKQKAFLLSTAALASFFAATLPAVADTVLTFDRETTGSLRPERQRRGGEGNNDAPQPPRNADPKQTVTVHLKGALARVEFRPMGAKSDTAPTTVLLYDGMAQKVYTLNAGAKTYFAQSYKEAIDGERRQSGNANEGMANRMTFAGTVDLTAARANNAFVTKEILGAKTRQYLVAGNVEMKFNMPERPASEGTPPVYAPQGGGGGIPGGGNAGWQGREGWQNRQRGGQGGPGGGFGRGGFTPPSVAVDGEVWSTDGIALFTAGRDTPIAAIYRLMLPDNAGPFGGTLTKPLVTRLKNMKSLPGESTVSFRMSTNFRPQGNGEEASPTAAEAPLSTHLTMKEMKTDATLEDAIFAIPADYTLAEPPAPEFGRPGGGGWGRGPGGGRGPGSGGGRPGGNRNNEQ